MSEPKTFEEGLQRYAEAVKLAYQEQGSVPKALAAVSELRTSILNLPSQHGISRHFRIEQTETKVLAQYAACS